MKNYKVFAINPGSTSTKIAMFEGEKEIFSRNISHDAEKLKEFKEISDQLPYRKEMILNVLKEEGQTLEGVDAFSARGGGLVNVEGGVFTIGDKLLEHARTCYTVKHPATLGAQLADAFSKEFGGVAFVVNPPGCSPCNRLKGCIQREPYPCIKPEGDRHPFCSKAGQEI